MRALSALVALACLGACGPNTDLTVAPPPETEADVRAAIPQPLQTGRLPEWLRPLQYTLDVDIDPAAERFSGRVAIDIALDRPTRAFVLHASNLSILSAEVLADGVIIPAEASVRESAGATGQKEELVVVAKQRVTASEVKLRVAYTAPLGERLSGIYRVVEGGKPFVFTQFEPSDAAQDVSLFR